jgi:broad specificity phosphatase PhoE
MADDQDIAPPPAAPQVAQDTPTPPQPEPTPPEDDGGGQQPPTPQPTPTLKLYQQLNKSNLYTKSFDEFQKQFSTPASIDKLYQNLNSSGLYTKDKGAFYGQFFPNQSGGQGVNVDKAVQKTTQNLSQPLQFNGTFKPDVEGEQNGLYLNDPDYQAQKKDFTSRIATDENGYKLYPEMRDDGKMYNYYTGKPLQNFDPNSMRGKILEVPSKYLKATGGEQFITPKYDWDSNSYNFPSVQTPDVPHQQTLPQATVYGTRPQTTVDPDKSAIRKQYPEITDLHDSKFVDDILNKNKDKNFVQRYLNPSKYPVINNPDGSFSTHRMASSDNLAYPTIVQQPDGSLKQLGDKEAYQYAIKNKEYIQFKNDKDADWFANNGYKLGTQNGTSTVHTTDGNQPAPIQKILQESDKQGGQFRDVLKEHPELSGDVVKTLNKFGPEYAQSLDAGSQGMSNVLQKTVEDKYNLNQPLPKNVDPDILNGHLNVVNNFEKNRNEFEGQQQELQHQADLLTDRAKRTGTPVSQEDADRLAQKAAQNLQRWNAYTKTVNFSQNYLNQPEVKNYLTEFQKRQQGIGLMDEIRQRSFPDDTNAQIKQDEYDRKAVEGNTGVLDYLKTAAGSAGKGIANIGEGAMRLWSYGQPTIDPSVMSTVEKLNNNAQQFLSSNLPAISPDAIKQIKEGKTGLSTWGNDIASTIGGFAPYIVPGLAEEAGIAKAGTFATALAESLPTVRKEAESAGLTGSAYNTYLAAKPLVNAAFMTLLPNIKFAKGFEKDVAESVVNGEFNNPKKFLLNLASKAVKDPNDVAHLQAMLTGTNLGNAVVNQVTNGLQAKEDLQRGISRQNGLSTDVSGAFDPRQTAVMALAAKALEAVPTLKNALGDYQAGKDVAETYDHIQNNLVELAAQNSKAVSAQVDAMLKKDPGNIYAQHLKNTLEDFTDAQLRMPQGLEPEQKAALFDVQKQISQVQRQMAYADPVYKPHLQKNIDELTKQIPELLKDPKKANDYLQDSHNDLIETINSPKTEANGKTTENAQAQGGQEIEKPEGAADAGQVGTAPSIESNPAYRTLDYGNNKGKDETPEAKDQIEKEILNNEPVGKTGEKLSDLVGRVIPEFQKSLNEDPHNTAIVTHSSVIKALHVWEEMGRPSVEDLTKNDRVKPYDGPMDMKGYPPDTIMHFNQGYDKNRVSLVVDPEIKAAYSKQLADRKRITQGSGAGMKHPLRDIAKEFRVGDGKDVIVDLRGIDINKPIAEIKKQLESGSKLKEFAQRYVDIKPEAEGKVHTFTGDNGNDIKVVRHGETEDNKMSEFREDNTQLTDKGEAQAGKAGDNLIKETGGNIPKLISSDMPRTLHTSEIIKQKLQDHVPLRVRSATEKISRPEGSGENIPGSGERIRSGQQGNGPAREGGEPSTEKENPSKEGSGESNEPDKIGTKRSINDVVRQRMGLSPVPIPKLGSDAEEMSKAKARVDSEKSSPLDLVHKIISAEDVNDIGLSVNDRYDMQYHMLQLKQKSLELNRAMSETTDKLAEDPADKKAQEDFISLTQQRAQHLDDEIRATMANRIGSAVWGKSGRAMDVEMDEHGNVLARIERIKTWYGGDVPPDVQKKIDDIQKQLDESNAQLQKLQEDYNKKVVENEALKAAKGAAKKPRKTSDEFNSERKDIVKDIKQALKDVRGNLGASVVPGVQELAAIAPHLVKLFKSYAEEGFQKVDEVLDKMLGDVQEAVPGITKNDIHDVLAGKYKETKKPIEKNQDYVKAQQSKANAMMMLRKVEQQAMDSKKNLYMKALDFAKQWERRAIFAFNNAVFVKLSSAALIGSTLHKPLEFGVGKVASKVFPKLADKAIIEGNENLASLAKYYSEEFNPVKFAQQTWQIYKRGESGLTQELSQKGHTGYSYDKWYDYAKPVLDAYTNTHQVIKDPIKRAVMESSMMNILQWYRGHGMDPSHPLIMEDARQYAYKRAEYEIFQNKQGISSKINQFIGQLEKSGIIEAGQPGLHDKITGNLKYTAATLYHMLVPIATVPINITARASVGALLPYNIIKAYHLENNIKDLQPEQADIVMRNLKKGSIGAAYWALGIYLVGNAGGLWNRYDPDKKKSGKRDIDLKPDRPHSDVLKLGDLDIPKGVQHTPQLQALQYGATFANVHNHYAQDLKEPEYKAWGAGIMSMLAGMTENVPPAEETKKLIEGIEDPAQLQKVGQDLKRGFGYNKLQDAGILPPDAPTPPKGHHQTQHHGG